MNSSIRPLQISGGRVDASHRPQPSLRNRCFGLAWGLPKSSVPFGVHSLSQKVQRTRRTKQGNPSGPLISAMAAHSTIPGQEPAPGAGTIHYPSPNTNTSRSSQNQVSSNRNQGTTESSALLEEQLVKLPPIFRRKTHQQCFEMEANRFIAPEDAGRGRMALAVLRDDHYLFDLVTKSLITVAYMLVFLMVAGAVFGAVAATFGLPVFVIVRILFLSFNRGHSNVR